MWGHDIPRLGVPIKLTTLRDDASDQGGPAVLNPLNPFVYLLAYLAMLYIRPHDYAPAWQGIPVLPVTLILCFGTWLARQHKDFSAPQNRMLLVQLVVMSVSVAVNGWGGGAFAVATEFGTVLILYYIIATSIDAIDRMRAVFFLLTVASSIMAIHGIQQVEEGVAWTGAVTVNGGRITYLGFLADPNDLAMSMLMTLPMCLYLAFKPSGFLLRQFARACAILILYGISLANSRGALLGFFAMVFVFSLLHFGRKAFLLPLLAIPIILAAPGRLSEMSSEEESAAGRVDAWYQGFQMLMSHPFLGVGKGMFTDHHWLTAHNSYVLVLAELGLVGYFVWLSSIILTGVMLWKLIRAQPPTSADGPRDAEAVSIPFDPEDWAQWQRASRALLYGFTAALVCSFFLSRSYVIILYVHIALVVASYQYARARAWIDEVTFRQIRVPTALATLGSTAALWLVTKVLL
jgi:hypothetical protein